MKVQGKEGPRIEYVRPFLYPKQIELFYAPERFVFCEASTKSGKTHSCIVWLVEMALLHGAPGRNYWWVAPIRSQAKIAYNRIWNASDKRFVKKNESELFIEFPNGARIYFKSGDNPDALYGEDVYAAVGDEVSRMRYDSYIALRTTLTATGGPLRLIANVVGKNNWFYIECRAVERGRENCKFGKITAQDAVDAGVLDGKEIKLARQMLPEKEFTQLYLAEAIDDENAFIPSDAVHAAIARHKTIQGRGALILGADPSQGKRDSAAFVLRRGSEVIHVEEHRAMDETGFKGHLIRLIQAYKPNKVFVDGTGFGTTIVKDMHETHTAFQQLIKPINFASGSLYPDEYCNKRAEMWGEMRKWLLDENDPVSLPDDAGLAVELTCINKAPHSSGRLLLESKENLLSRGYESTNKADALGLTFAEPVNIVLGQKINYTKKHRSRIIT